MSKFAINECRVVGEVKALRNDEFNGRTTKLVVIDTTEGQYTTMVEVALLPKAEAANPQVGDLVAVRGAVESRESKGRYFTKVKAFEVKILQSAADF